jgi:hypothetical protein
MRSIFLDHDKPMVDHDRVFSNALDGYSTGNISRVILDLRIVCLDPRLGIHDYHSTANKSVGHPPHIPDVDMITNTISCIYPK